MDIVNSQSLLDEHIAKCNIREKFSSCHPKMYLFHYSPGEFLTSPFSPAKFIQFITEGEVKLYDMPSESSTTILPSPYYSVSFLGEVELLDSKFIPFFIEAKSDVYTVAISLEQNRDELLNDNAFLRFICSSLVAKLSSAVSICDKKPLREQFLLYLTRRSSSEAICDITQLSQFFNVSSRQMLRVLKQLCEEGLLVHEGHGKYSLPVS